MLLSNFEGAIRGSLMQQSKPTFHVLSGEHIDIFGSNGFQNMFDEIVVQLKTRHSCNEFAGPIDAHSVLPLLPWLVNEWLAKNVLRSARKLRSSGRVIFSDFGVKEGVPEPSYRWLVSLIARKHLIGTIIV